MALALFSYLAGSIPFGLLIGWLAGRDVRRDGSHNIGASNVFRLCGWRCGLATFFLDFLKGLAPVIWLVPWLGNAMSPPFPGILAAFAAVLGHNFPVWLRFRGGKGVATSAGGVAGLMPLPFMVAFAAFFAVVAVWRYTSLGSMLASLVLALATFFLLPDPLGENLPLFLLTPALSVLIFVRHRHNISRILAGTENRFPPPRKNAETDREDGQPGGG
ncbi:MAG: glycerol-3-phosphate 1-O-acyltransferase PlsY [Planctomycetota bacterium]|jgi:glycerol-3-phosphate acyltransferase PlsY|nr:glycerol-3-phosphate 1-O-acyltransferase PlsY [Planctomycetota bacterium]